MIRENLANAIEQFKKDANEIDLGIQNHAYSDAGIIEQKAKMATLDYVVRVLEEIL